MEQIIRDALPMLEDKSQPQNVSDDWIANFFEKGRMISDEQMQHLWSKILAGEANRPGTFSRKTVNLLSDLDKTDADLFTCLCGFIWTLRDQNRSIRIPLVFHNDPFSDEKGLDFERLTHLDSLGLICFESDEFGEHCTSDLVQISYYGRTALLKLKKSDNYGLDVGVVILTRVGGELARVCNASPVEGLFESITQTWKDNSLLLQII
jgi:hypothetical protein